MKLGKVILASTLILSLGSTLLFADAAKGQKIFSKKMKTACDMTGAKFAAKHSQNEWEEIMENGLMEDEIIKICPSIEKGQLKEKWLPHIYDFSYEYANDSGNVPSC